MHIVQRYRFHSFPGEVQTRQRKRVTALVEQPGGLGLQKFEMTSKDLGR